MSTEALLSIRDLVVRYRGPGGTLTAVNGVSLDIPPGGIVALVGESGSGKTSLARAALKLLPVESGQVLLRGDDLARMKGARLKAARRDIQAIFQDPNAALSPRRSVFRSLVEPLDHFAIGDRAERRERVEDALQAVGLDPALLARFPHELSGGQRQRLALARALAPRPALVIADEPMSSLDLPAQARILELIGRLREERDLAFLLVTHDLSAARRLADRIAVMYLGRLVEAGPADRVLAKPAHPYTKALLRAVPSIDPRQPPPEVLGGEPPSPLTPPGGCVFHSRCSEALPRCADEPPGAREIGGLPIQLHGHRVTCHLWET